MRKRKLLAVLLSATMVLSLVGCGKKEKKEPTTVDNPATTDSAPSTDDGAKDNEEVDISKIDVTDDSQGNYYGGLKPLPDANDPITFKFFIRDPEQVASKDNPVLKKITELTGVTIDFEFLVGDLEQKEGVMIAGEDYPDAIFVGGDAPKFIDAGAHIPIEDYIAKYPNLRAEYTRYADKMTAKDGHQYIFELYGNRKNPAPVFTDTGVGFYIQKAVLEDAGYPIPKTLDEYFKLIDDYKAKYPEIDGVKTIGFEICCDPSRDFCLRNPSQHLMGAGNDGDVFVDDNNVATYYQISDTAKAYYKKLNEEYQKGIIEAETLTESLDQYIARLSTGAVLGMFDQQWNFGNAENVLKTEGKDNRTYVAVPITNPGVQDSYLDKPGDITGNNGIGITKNCKNPDRLCKFFDWLLQPEVQNYLQWGEEGKDFTVSADGGKLLTEERRTINKDTAKRRDLTGFYLSNYMPHRQGLYDDGSPCSPADSADEYLAALSEYDQKFLGAYGFKYPAQLLSEPEKRPDFYPCWSMHIDEGSDAAVAQNKLTDICRKFYPKLIICDSAKYDGLWDDFLGEVKKGKVEPYVDEVNRQIQDILNK